MTDLTLDMIREMPLSVLHSEVARLNEENQRLKAKPAGQALDEIREVVQLREANERLRKTWEVEADSHAANVAELRAKLAEAKRDTERLDWLEEAVPSGRLRQAAEDMTTWSGTVRSLIDALRRMPPTPETKGAGNER